MDQIRAEMQNSVPAQIKQQVDERQRAQEIYTSFYAAYPNLNKPELRQLVAATASQVMTERMTNDWSNDVQKATGERVLKLLGQPAPPNGATPAPVPAPAANPASTPAPAAPPKQFGTGKRPSAPAQTDADSEEISRTLFGG